MVCAIVLNQIFGFTRWTGNSGVRWYMDRRGICCLRCYAGLVIHTIDHRSLSLNSMASLYCTVKGLKKIVGTFIMEETWGESV